MVFIYIVMLLNFIGYNEVLFRALNVNIYSPILDDSLFCSNKKKCSISLFILSSFFNLILQ